MNWNHFVSAWYASSVTSRCTMAGISYTSIMSLLQNWNRYTKLTKSGCALLDVEKYLSMKIGLIKFEFCILNTNGIPLAILNWFFVSLNNSLFFSFLLHDFHFIVESRCLGNHLIHRPCSLRFTRRLSRRVHILRFTK